MEVNPSKTKALVISRSRTKYPEFPGLYLNGAPVEVVRELKLLGIILDSKLTFEAQIRSIVASTSSKLGILRKVAGLYCDVEVVTRSFWSFVLPLLEYCSAVWSGAATCHLSLLDRVVRRAVVFSEGEVKCDLLHRRKVASLCMFYKIFNNASHYRWDCIIQISWSLVGLHGEQLWCMIMFWWLLGVELSSIRGLLSQLVLLFGITLMALFLMVWIWVASSLRLIVLFLDDCCVFFSFNFFLFIFEWLTAWRFC